jgi:uncharacterized DUF497 family protein
MRFEWDHRKARDNAKKHGVTFEQAITAFDDPFALVTLDVKHSTSEKREWLIGESDVGVLVVVFTVRQPGNIYRVIAARKAKRKERKRYEEIKKLSI